MLPVRQLLRRMCPVRGQPVRDGVIFVQDEDLKIVPRPVPWIEAGTFRNRGDPAIADRDTRAE